jgi:hypothetical protein
MKLELRRSPHPSEEMLLAWSEGELSWWRARLVSRHIRSCWSCRLKARKWEELACRVAAGLDELPEPTRVDTAKAWWRFQQACAGIESAPARRAWRVGPAWVTAAASVIAAAGVAVVTIQRPLLDEPNKPASATRRAPAPKLQTPSFVLPPAPARPQAEPVRSVPQGSLVPEVAAPPDSPSEDELLSAEIYALYELHRSRLCSLEVSRSGSAIEVRGVMVDPERRARLAALFGAPEFKGLIRLNLIEEGDVTASAGSPLAAPTTANSSASPLETSLRQRFGDRVSQREVFSLMGEIVLEAEAVSEHAWALHRIAMQFPWSRTRGLRPAFQDLLLRIAADHANAAANASSALWRRMEPAPEMASTPDLLASDPGGRNQTWQERALLLHQSAESAAAAVLRSVDPKQLEAPPAAGSFRDCASAARALHASLQTQLAQLP